MTSLHNFPSHRLRHAIRKWRYRRRYPYLFVKDEPSDMVADDVVRLPLTEDVPRSDPPKPSQRHSEA